MNFPYKQGSNTLQSHNMLSIYRLQNTMAIPRERTEVSSVPYAVVTIQLGSILSAVFPFCANPELPHVDPELRLWAVAVR